MVSGLHQVSVMLTIRGFVDSKNWRSGILLQIDLALMSTTVCDVSGKQEKLVA